jgi:hypothetical protein
VNAGTLVLNYGATDVAPTHRVIPFPNTKIVFKRTNIRSWLPQGPETRNDSAVCLVIGCWLSAAQLLLVPSSAGLMTIFFSLTTLRVVLAGASSNLTPCYGIIFYCCMFPSRSCLPSHCLATVAGDIQTDRQQDSDLTIGDRITFE